MKDITLKHSIHKMPATIRLLISISLATIVYFVFQNNLSSSELFMVTWVGFALIYLILFWITILTATPHEIKLIAKKQDSSRPVIFFFVIIAAFISLFAIVLLLRILPTKESGYYFHVALSITSVICSWVLIHTIFTFHYAHLFYTCKSEEQDVEKEYTGGLEFPNDQEPDYIDFAYFSFVIGMTFQVSDVQITSSYFRRLALLHGLLSFAYNTVILALSINIISGLIQK